MIEITSQVADLMQNQEEAEASDPVHILAGEISAIANEMLIELQEGDRYRQKIEHVADTVNHINTSDLHMRGSIWLSQGARLVAGQNSASIMIQIAQIRAIIRALATTNKTFADHFKEIREQLNQAQGASESSDLDDVVSSLIEKVNTSEEAIAKLDQIEQTLGQNALSLANVLEPWESFLGRNQIVDCGISLKTDHYKTEEERLTHREALGLTVRRKKQNHEAEPALSFVHPDVELFDDDEEAVEESKA